MVNMVSGEKLISYIKENRLEHSFLNMEDHEFDVKLDDGKTISYNVMEETITLWPSNKTEDHMKCPVEITKTEALAYRAAGKADDYNSDI